MIFLILIALSFCVQGENAPTLFDALFTPFVSFQSAAKPYLTSGSSSLIADAINSSESGTSRSTEILTEGVNKTIFDRQQAFNFALKEYLVLDQKNDTSYSTGALEYNIGNTFYQLDDIPVAILYYLKSLKLRPRDKEVWKHLQTAKERMTVTEKTVVFPLSPPERLQLMSFFLFLAFLFFSIWIWRGLCMKLATVFVGISLLFLLSALYSRYVEPLSGVVVVESPLYLGPASSYAQLTSNSLKAGQVVDLLKIEEGGWLKVETSNGKVGFIRSQSVVF